MAADAACVDGRISAGALVAMAPFTRHLRVRALEREGRACVRLHAGFARERSGVVARGTVATQARLVHVGVTAHAIARLGLAPCELESAVTARARHRSMTSGDGKVGGLGMIESHPLAQRLPLLRGVTRSALDALGQLAVRIPGRLSAHAARAERAQSHSQPDRSHRRASP